MPYAIQKTGTSLVLDRHFCIWVDKPTERDTFETADQALAYAKANAPQEDPHEAVFVLPRLDLNLRRTDQTADKLVRVGYFTFDGASGVQRMQLSQLIDWLATHKGTLIHSLEVV